MRVMGAIYSLRFPVRIEGKKMSLFDARDQGLIDLNFDPHWRYYSYQVISTGEIVSFYSWFREEDRSDWYREAKAKRVPQSVIFRKDIRHNR